MRPEFLIEKMHTVGMAAAALKTGLTSGFGVCCPEKRQRAVRGHQLEQAMSVNTLITLAKTEARRLQQAGPAAVADNPKLRSAVAQVWAMLQPRLGGGAAVQELDVLIQDLVGRPASR
jgi:hypothetical protein